MSTGKLANRYNPVRLLGEGAMGQVWLMEDTVRRMPVALKVISERYGRTEKSFLQFKQEFRLMAQLRHPNCCAVYDYGFEPSAGPFITMEVVDGVGLDEGMPLADADAFRSVLSQLLLALGYVHSLGFVHCDLKPANVRVKPDGTVKLMDYGLMEFSGHAGGALRGTIAYMSPEIIKRGHVDQRSDLYSVGVLAYEMLTGRPPFVAPKPFAVLQSHLSDRPQPPSRLRPGIDPAFERIVLKLLEKEPIDRYQSAAEVLEDLGIEVPAGIGGNLLSSPLVGREAELGVLKAHLSALAERREGAALVVWGPQGLGKTRLVEEFRFHAQLAELPYAGAINHQFAQSPYAPIVSALRSLMPAFKAHARDELERLAPVLVKLLPELGVPDAPPLEPSQEKMRLQSALTDLVVALARRQGLVVVVEDCQWADPLSKEFLAYVLRRIADAPLLLVLTQRQPPTGSEWAEPLQPLALGELDREGLRAMVGSMLGTGAVEPEFLAQLEELSRGNPFVLEMLIEHLVREGVLIHDRGRWRTDGAAASAGLPGGLRDYMAGKLGSLPAAALAVATAAAAIGYAFDLELLQRVMGLSADALLEAVAILEQQHVFVKGEDERYHFYQDVIQDVLYDGLAPTERKRLHTNVAEALEAAVGHLPLRELSFERITAIADQAMRGDCPERLVTYCYETGMRSAKLLASSEAEHYLSTCLAVMRKDPFRYRLELVHGLRHLGDGRRLLGRFEDAQQAYEEAIPLAEAIGEHAVLAAMWTSLGKVHQVASRFDAALAACARGLDIAQAIGDHAEAARSLQTSGRVRYFKGDAEGALAHNERALAAARLGGDETQIANALGFLGYLYVTTGPGRIEEGARYLQESVESLSRLGDRIGLHTALDYLGNAQKLLGVYSEARETFLAKQRICLELGYRDEQSLGLSNLADTALHLGRYEEAARSAQEAALLAKFLGSRYPLGIAMMLEALALAYMGEVQGALLQAEEALALGAETGNKYMLAHLLSFHLEMLLYLGRLEAANATAQTLSKLVAETGHKEPESLLNALLGEVRLRLGDEAGAKACLQAALNTALLAEARGVQVIALKGLARLALSHADWGSAERLAQEALMLSDHLGMRFHSAELEGLLGELALATGSSGAMARFEAMLERSADTDAPVLRPLALFGLAAAAPYDPMAPGRAAEARAALLALVEGLQEPERAAFLSLSERRRVIEGNFVGFSLPRAIEAAAPKPPPLGVPREHW